MKSVYIVMTATGTWFSKCIGLYTRARYNHASICLDSGINEFYSFGRKITWFPLIGGFVIEHKDTGLFKAFGNTMCAIYRLDVDDNQFDELKKFVQVFIKNRKMYGYNILGLIGIMLNIPMGRKNKFFCTQFVATMLQMSNIYDFKKDPSLVTPQDLYEIKELIPVYEGRLSDLNRGLSVNRLAVNG